MAAFGFVLHIGYINYATCDVLNGKEVELFYRVDDDVYRCCRAVGSRHLTHD
jgi:hypothetical protein